MADIDDFAELAATKFLESDQINWKNEGLRRFHLGLSAPSVKDVVRAVFYASMIPDEGRYPVVSLMSYRGDAYTELHLPLFRRLPLTQQDIAKLAHAVGPESHLCIVCDEGKPELGGIHVTVLEEMRHFGYSSFRVGNPLSFRIRGPGHIETSTGGIAVIFKAGEITEEKPLQSSDVMRELGDEISAELERQTTAVVESLEDVFNDIAKAIVWQGHGGILIVTKSWDANQFSSHRRTDSDLLRRRLIRYYESVAALNLQIGQPAQALAGSNAEQASPQFLTIASETAALEKCVKLIANLAGMDGAIVLDYACNVAAFNAIITRDMDNTDPVRFVDEIGRTIDAADIGKNRGSRHQSAMSFAQRVANSFTFVISQDGGVSAFHNRGDGTCRWEGGLRVLD